MKKSVFLFMLITLFILVAFSVKASAFDYSFADIYEETYWEPTGGYNYGTTDSGAGLGVYQGTYLGNLSDSQIIPYFIAAGFTDVELVDITITNTGYAGTWDVVQVGTTPPMEVLDFLIVKGGTSLSFHEYDPAANYGIWNVGYLADAGGSGAPPMMSHLSATYTGGGSGQTEIPEPATMLLLGTGLIGLAGVGRKKLMK